MERKSSETEEPAERDGRNERKGSRENIVNVQERGTIMANGKGRAIAKQKEQGIEQLRYGVVS